GELLRCVEPALLEEVMRRVQDNRWVAAQWLGLNRATVRKKLKLYGLESVASGNDEEEREDEAGGGGGEPLPPAPPPSRGGGGREAPRLGLGEGAGGRGSELRLLLPRLRGVTELVGGQLLDAPGGQKDVAALRRDALLVGHHRLVLAHVPLTLQRAAPQDHDL